MLILLSIAVLLLLVQLVINIDNNRKLKEMADELKNLTAAVAAETTVDQAAATLLSGLKTELDAAIASNDPAQLQALSDQLGTSTAALTAAIAANTPAEAPVTDAPAGS